MATELITDIINENNKTIRPKTLTSAIIDWDAAFETKVASLHLISTASLNNTLAGYVTTANLAQTNSNIALLNAQVTLAQDAVNMIANDYINNSNLPNAINALGIPTAGTLDNYYTKDEVNNNFLSSTTSNNYYTKTQIDNKFVSTASLTNTLSAYAIKTDLENTYALYDSVYTKSEVYTTSQTYNKDEVYSKSQTYSQAVLYTQSQIDTKLANIYTKAETNSQLINTCYTKAEIDDKLANAASGGQIDLTGYVTTSSLNTILNDYVAIDTLNSTLLAYPTHAEIANSNFLTSSSVSTISLSRLINDGDGINPFITNADIAPVGLSGLYDDLVATPISKHYLENVSNNYVNVATNAIVFEGNTLSSANYANNWFLLLCQIQVNTEIVTTAWISAPGIRFIQQLNLFNNSPTIYPELGYTNSGILYVKIAGAGTNVYDVNSFIIQTK